MNQRRGLEVRAANGADAAGLSALLEVAGGPWPPAELARRLDAARAAAGTVLLALDWGPPVGLVALHWFPSLLAGRLVAQLDLLLVGQEDRRRGIGRILVKAAAQAARVAGCGDMQFVVNAGQTDLRAFCLATGFTETGSCLSRALRKQSE